MRGRARSILPVLALSLLPLYGAFAGDPPAVTGRLALRVSVPLTGFQTSHLPWRWSSASGIYLPDSHAEETCVTLILRSPARPGFADIWTFRAERSTISGFADDLHLAPDGVCRTDSGAPAWRMVLPPASFSGEETLSRYAFQKPEGSRGDVKVSGSFDPGAKIISLVFERVRDTGHPDDLVLAPGMEYAILLRAPGMIPPEEKLSFRIARFISLAAGKPEAHIP